MSEHSIAIGPTEIFIRLGLRRSASSDLFGSQRRLTAMRPNADCGMGPEMGCVLRYGELLAIPHPSVRRQRIDILNEIENRISLLSRAAGVTSHTGHGQIPVAAIAPQFCDVAVTSLDIVSHRWKSETAPRAAIVSIVAIVTLCLGVLAISAMLGLTGRQDQLSGQDAIDAVVGRIIRAESHGDSSAKNKNSTAAGVGQFIDETWLRMIRHYRPDLAAVRSKDETLKLRGDATIAREITARFAERNASLLKKHGFPVTVGNVYLAHFAGGAGSIAILSAPDSADAALVMAGADATGKTTREQIVKANPFLNGFTVADLKRWADRKMRRHRHDHTPNDAQLVASTERK